ncbi:MAG TPA: phosphoribosyltransferase [Stenomitos sp.]
MKRPEPLFINRADAGQHLALELRDYAHRPQVIVLGVPRGGVPVAFEVARSLEAPLSLCLVRKLGVPHQPELAMGAIASGGVRYLDPEIIARCRVSPELLEQVIQREQRELERRERQYYQSRPLLPITDRIVIVVDDGMATGATMRVALAALRQHSLQKLVVAIPVAPASSLEALNGLADTVICLATPDPFHAVGEWYQDFSQVEDDTVCALLRRSQPETN